MSIKSYKPTTPSRRQMTVSGFDGIDKKAKPEPSLIESLKKSSGRNSYGHITVRHRGGGNKRKYRIIDFKRDKQGTATVLRLEYDPNRSANIALIQYEDGEKRYILAPVGMKAGHKIMTGPDADILPGNALPIEKVPVGTIIHNIELHPGNGAQLVRSAGTAAQLMAKEGGDAQIRMPSGEVRIVRTNCLVTIGQVGNIEHENINIGKAGRKRHMKRYGILTNTGIWAALVIMVSFIAGSSFVMWMGEQVTEFGIGNGISIILFAGILSRVPSMVSSFVKGVSTWSGIRSGSLTEESLTSAGYTVAQAQNALAESLAPWSLALIVIGILALIVFIVFINGAERRIPVQYAKRQVGRKMYGGQNSTLPMKVNMSGVLPIIFAQSIASLPATVMAFTGVGKEGTFSYALSQFLDTKSVLYMVVYFILIIGFSYFYSTIQFNPVEIANNLKKQGGFIPGFRPGKPTVDFIKKVLSKVTLFGAIYLGIVAMPRRWAISRETFSSSLFPPRFI